MTTRLVNAYTISPSEIKAGDVMLFVVKAMIVRPGIYRLYRCPFEGYMTEDIPQGCRIGVGEREICETLFPSLALVAEPDAT